MLDRESRADHPRIRGGSFATFAACSSTSAATAIVNTCRRRHTIPSTTLPILAADLAQVVASLVHSPYAILAHSAGALAAARFITNTRASIPAAMLNAFVWVDLDPLVAASIPPSLMSGSGPS